MNELENLQHTELKEKRNRRESNRYALAIIGILIVISMLVV